MCLLDELKGTACFMECCSDKLNFLSALPLINVKPFLSTNTLMCERMLSFTDTVHAKNQMKMQLE